MRWREAIARILAPEVFVELAKKEEEVQMHINQRVAEVLLKMDPFEPFLKKYNVIFSEEWDRPEDNLDERSKFRLTMWAYGTKKDPSFLHLINFLRDTQGNATLRKAKNDNEWFYGRAAIATLTLFVEEIGRLSSQFEETRSRKDQTFDEHLVVE